MGINHLLHIATTFNIEPLLRIIEELSRRRKHSLLLSCEHVECCCKSHFERKRSSQVHHDRLAGNLCWNSLERLGTIYMQYAIENESDSDIWP